MVGVLRNLAALNAEVKAAQYVVVDFFATWCGPCKMLAPKLEAMAASFPHVKFFKVDVDEAEDCAQHFKIEAMPTIVFFTNGVEVNRVTGANESAIKSQVTAWPK